MTIFLNHTIVPAHNKGEAARWFAQIIGLHADGSGGHFAPVRVNDTLTLLFSDEAAFDQRHYAFHVSDAEFELDLRSREAKGSAFWKRALERRGRQAQRLERRARRLFPKPRRPFAGADDGGAMTLAANSFPVKEQGAATDWR